MQIILFLGLAGKHQGQITKAYYSNNTHLTEIKGGEYINSTDALFLSFPSADFEIITTQKALDTQKEIFANNNHHLALLQKNIHIIHDENDEKIFDIILDSIHKSKSENIILDITHGMRHQLLLASFSATLAKIDSKKNIKILFAKEVKQFIEYEYIFLDDYTNISINAILLDGFTKTLTLPKLPNPHYLIQSLQDFAGDLHTNAFVSLFNTTLPKALKSIENFKKDSLHTPLENFIQEIERILLRFQKIAAMEDYKKYYEIAQIMYEKEYYLISVTYAFEAIPKYLITQFTQNGILKKNECKEYDKAQAIQQFILGQIANDKIYSYEKACFYLDNNKEVFKKLKEVLESLKDIRNNLAHISQDYDTKNIDSDLKEIYASFYALCVEKDNLKECDFSKLYDCEKLALKIHDYFANQFQHELSMAFQGQIKTALNYYEGKDLPIRKEYQAKYKKDSKVKKILDLLYQYKDLKYLTKEQGRDFDAIFEKNH